MNIIDNYRHVVVENYANVEGRAARPEYWLFFLANLIILAVLLALTAASSIFIVLYFVYALAIIIPSIMVGIRRLHDTDRSGWWLLITFVPLVGGIILLVLMVLPGTEGDNQFGAATT